MLFLKLLILPNLTKCIYDIWINYKTVVLIYIVYHFLSLSSYLYNLKQYLQNNILDVEE